MLNAVYFFSNRPRHCDVAIVLAATAAASGLSAAVIAGTGSMIGMGTIYAVASGAVARLRGVSAGIGAALIASAVLNVVFVHPQGLNVPSVNEVVLYASLLGVAFLAGRASVDPRLPSANTEPVANLAPSSAGDDPVERWALECAVGVQDARRDLRNLVWGHQTDVLGMRLKRAIRRGRWSGIEAGYCAYLSASLLAQTRPVPAKIASILAHDDTHDRQMQ